MDYTQSIGLEKSCNNAVRSILILFRDFFCSILQCYSRTRGIEGKCSSTSTIHILRRSESTQVSMGIFNSTRPRGVFLGVSNEKDCFHRNCGRDLGSQPQYSMPAIVLPNTLSRRACRRQGAQISSCCGRVEVCCTLSTNVSL